MSAQRIFSSKKLLEHGCFKSRKEPRVRGGEKGSVGKGRKKGI